MNSMERFVRNIPKAELHVHIEGTLEPELMFKLAKRNNVKLKYKSEKEIKEAYNFHNLQSFLDIYYEGANVLLKEEDFYDLTWAYLEKVHSENVLHTEVFFDPQTHTKRGVSFEVIISGINSALKDGYRKFGISSFLIMCFLRHLSSESAMKTLKEAIPFKDLLKGVGLDSSELGNPPSKFSDVFKEARKYDLLSVAHAGEEGPPEYIWQAIKDLQVMRIDHGVRCLEDKLLVEEIIKKDIPLTICPLSNIKLAVFSDLEEHNLKEIMDAGITTCVNSDDPAYFGGYVADNLLEIQKALGLEHKDIYLLANNSVQASFLSKTEKGVLFRKIKDFAKATLSKDLISTLNIN